MNKEEQKFTRLKNVIRLSKRLKKYRLRMWWRFNCGRSGKSVIDGGCICAWGMDSRSGN